jgi:predicted membrane channel-forming protein YqfA (hemolysin III family)
MSKNPLINALGAAAYILLGVIIMNFVTEPLKNKPDTFFAPVVFLSLLTLSVAVMAYLFFYQPIQLFIDGHKKEALNLFAKTTGIFAVFTAIALILLSAGLI